ncbi:MAG: DUF4124 domain-containing protein [Burkholderiaceae bacterium]
MSLLQSIAGRLFAAGLTLISIVAVSTADAGVIYRCQSASGVVEYSNSLPGAGKSCEKIALPTITTIPAPAPVTAAIKSRKEGADAAFPKVKETKQRERDTDRARILRDELKREEQKLAALRKEFNNGEPDRRGDERNYQKYLDRVDSMKADITRREGNIKALQRELAALKP